MAITPPQQPYSFQQMQQQGYARPSWQMAIRPPTGTMATQTTAGAQLPPPPDPGGKPPVAPVSLGQAMTTASVGQMRPWQYVPGSMPQQQQGGLSDQYLWQQYLGYQPQQPFQWRQPQTQLPQYQQGAQFNAQTGGYSQVPGYQQQGQQVQAPQGPQQAPQGFSFGPFDYQQQPIGLQGAPAISGFNAGAYGTPQGLDPSAQYQPVGGPQLRQQGAFNAQATPFQGQLEQALGAAIGNPSAYGSQNVLSQFDVLNRRLGQEYDVERQKINEDMARRGLYSSTVAGGRLGDVAVRQAQAQGDLATNMLNQSAARYGQDRSAALAQAMGYGGLQFGNQLAGYQANLAGSNQNFQQDLAARAFQGDQNALAALNAMQRGQFGLQQQGQGFQQGLAGFNANLGAQGQQFGQNLAGAQFGQSEAARQFGQGLQGYQTNLGTQQQQFQNEMARTGMQSQLGTQGLQNQIAAQGFNQGLGQQGFENALQQALMGQQFGQQGFQNQLAQFQTNAGQRQQDFGNQAQIAAMQNAGNQQGFQNQLAGYGMNLGAQQQGFNQQQQLLQNLMGYGQQSFENQLAYQNMLGQNDIWQQIMPMLGLYGAG